MLMQIFPPPPKARKASAVCAVVYLAVTSWGVFLQCMEVFLIKKKSKLKCLVVTFVVNPRIKQQSVW